MSLDGSASFDDNTDSSLLQYAWTVVSAPPESAVTTLTGANTVAASFVPDVAGTYVVQLVVTDQDGLVSQPSEVIDFGENLPPTAEAGADRLVIVNEAVTLSGSAEDLDGDTISYQWSMTRAPSGSAAQLVPPNDPETMFIADRPGIYVATLTPSDFLGAGTAASATITAISATTFAAMQLRAAAEQLHGLPASASHAAAAISKR